MADEYDAAQAKGSAATRGQRSNARGSGISDLDELGLSSQRISEWREVRDAGPEVVEPAAPM